MDKKTALFFIVVMRVFLNEPNYRENINDFNFCFALQGNTQLCT